MSSRGRIAVLVPRVAFLLAVVGLWGLVFHSVGLTYGMAGGRAGAPVARLPVPAAPRIPAPDTSAADLSLYAAAHPVWAPYEW